MTSQHDLPTRPRWRALLAAALALAPAAGCRSNTGRVEDALRQRETDVRELREELLRTEAYNEALQRELHALRQSPNVQLTPEPASQACALKAVVLGRQTGGYNKDDFPGDELLQVVIEPRDGDGHAVKAPGSARVYALEITCEGLKRPLSSWYVAPEQLRGTWRSGLLSTGYFLVLPWKSYPLTEKVRVVVQFTLADGRVFEADKDVTVRPVAPPHRPPPPAVPYEEIEPPPTLPPPRKLDGPPLEGVKKFGDPPTFAEVGRPVAGGVQPAGAVQIMRPVPRR